MELNKARVSLAGASGGPGGKSGRRFAESGADLQRVGRDAGWLGALISGLGGTGARLERVAADPIRHADLGLLVGAALRLGRHVQDAVRRFRKALENGFGKGHPFALSTDR